MLLAEDVVLADPVGGRPRQIKAWAVAELIRNFVFFVDALRKLQGAGDVYLFTVSIWNCGRYEMPERLRGRFGEGRVNVFEEGQHLLLPPMYAPVDENPDATTRRLTDRLWNAFHFETCLFFDAEGRFFIPDR